MRNLEQEFVKATALPHNLFGTNRRGTSVPGRKLPEIPFSRELHIQRANPCSAINFRVADNPPETPQGYLVNLNA
jgi:hypothetical protein